jgi:phosphoglycolate phosphatase-like HAD superfamily hydrolase
MLKVAILDVDGTLVDSNDLHAWSWVEALQSEGYKARFEIVRPLIGMGGDRLMPKISGLPEDSPKGKKISERRKKIFSEKFLPRVKAFEGVRELLLKMKSSGLRLFVASSSGADLLDPLLERAQVKDLIDGTTSKDDAGSSKPAPDLIKAALRQAGVRAEEAIMLGDTPYDIEASLRADVRIVALASGGWPSDQLKDAHAIYRDPSDLLQNFDTSPFSQQRASAPTHP